MGREAFIDRLLVIHDIVQKTGTFLNRSLQRLASHGGFLGRFHCQPQARVHIGVGTIARGHHDFLGQFGENAAFGIRCKLFVFNFPLCAHGCSRSKSVKG